MSLRTKQALILFLATVLPFALGGAAMAFVVAPAYRRLVSHASVMETRRLAEHAGWNLARDIARLERLAAWSEVRSLAAAPPPAEPKARRLSQRWPGLAPTSPELRPILDGLVARELRWTQERDISAVELMLTDSRGRLVAASSKTDDYLQTDEGWWKRAYADGAGRVYVSDVGYDPDRTAWVLDVAVPVFADDSAASNATGVLKMTLDVQRAFQDVRRAGSQAPIRAMLVDTRGRVVIAPSGESGTGHALVQPRLHLLKQSPHGSVVTRSDENAELYAWSEVPLERGPDQEVMAVPTLYVVTQRNAEEAFGPLRAVHRWMLGIGLATIAIAVLIGYWLAEVLVVRQIRTLATGMRELARGDFERAAAIARRLTERNGHANDEVGREKDERLCGTGG